LDRERIHQGLDAKVIPHREICKELTLTSASAMRSDADVGVETSSLTPCPAVMPGNMTFRYHASGHHLQLAPTSPSAGPPQAGDTDVGVG
jgi:hypothetical protein